MRDIKFRVWKVDKKEMVYPFNWAARVGIIQSNKETTTTMMGSDTAMYTNDPTRCVWMQFTGLKDKNGKEIYEGDVVKCGVGQDAELAIVEFRMQAFVITYLPLERKDTDNVHDYMEDYKHFTVIGNIHENPELLK